jgi:ABC-2 type transport system ATP-binding protein
MDAVNISKLSKTYPRGVQALKGISVRVKKGEFFGFLGPNGAGKSTAIGILTSLVRKQGGSAQVFGHEAGTEQAKRLIGLVPQEFNFPIFEKVIDIVVQQAGFYGVPRKEARVRAEHELKRLGLWEKRDEAARNLSGGMKRKLMIARALLHKPKLLILDEPTAGVDVDTRREMWDYFTRLNKQGVTIILTTHYLEEAEELCERIAIINHGQIIKDTKKKSLLQQLDDETFILDTKPIKKLRPVTGVQFIDETTLKAVLPRGRSVNALLRQLDKQGIVVESMRNERNRLEELFVRLTR